MGAAVRDLSVLIPARNEQFLKQTVEDVLRNMRGDSEIIVVADGAWPLEPLDQHPRVQLVHMPTAIGQRAATNLAARISQARFVMKADAHVAVDEGFDVKLIAAAEQLGPDVTQIPRQYNLHVFDWLCQGCGTRTYQGPTPTACATCGAKGTPGGPFERVIVWNAIRRRTDTWCFDSTLKFGYFGDYQHRPEGHGDIADTMSCLGACWFVSRERYWQLGGLDEVAGSWGNMGTELACKSWLSGGRMVTNKKTWFSHCFRTQGGDFGFPYPLSGEQVERAREHTRRLSRNHAWPHQVRPLSWLVEKFWPVPGWSAEALAACQAEGVAFRIIRDCAQAAASVASDAVRQDMAVPAMGAASLLSARAVPSEDVVGRHDESQVRGVATARCAAHEMVEDEAVAGRLNAREGPNKPRVHDAVQSHLWTGGAASRESYSSIPEAVGVSCPQPTPGSRDCDLGKDAPKGVAVNVRDSENTNGHARIVSKGIVYYSDCRADESILEACRGQLKTACNGYPIVSATLTPLAFGRNIVLPLERGTLAMFRQILAGLEALDTDVAFLCEHDVLYDASHFEFTPPQPDAYFYNLNVWKVSAEDGRAIHYRTKQTSGLCANRELLIAHYRKRIARVEQDGFSRKMGFEPGSHKRPERVDDYPSGIWWSKVPNIDIRHGHNLTQSRWSPEQFRDQRNCEGWTESDRVPGWGLTRGRFREFLTTLGVPVGVR